MNNIYPWQQTIWQNLCEQHKQQRLPHALLLKGQEGLGKKDFAIHFAQFILCEQADQHSACGQCRSCHLFTNSVHPDFIVAEPEKEGAAIKVDAIRSLIQKLQKTCQQAEYRVALIDPAHKLNTAAANALLKTLEEPVGQSLLILVADQTSTLPATIISRCQQFSFNCYDNQQSLDWLATQLNTKDTTQLKQWLKLANYSPLKAVNMAQADYLKYRDQLITHLIAIQQKKINSISLATEIVKLDLEQWLQTYLSLCIDMIRLQFDIKADFITHTDSIQKLQQLSQGCSPLELQSLLSALLKTKRLLRANAPLNSTQVVEQLLLHWELKHECASRFTLSS